MLKEIKIQNFISHTDTVLKFNRGITIFVGHNGSGKSSAIDAITFALFGEHMRKCNKNLIHRGSSFASVNLDFSIGTRNYAAMRNISSTGQVTSAKLDLVPENNDSDHKTIVSGERRQFGESMSAEVSKIIGMDYKKLRVAAIVQQGELSKIIDSQPKEFKELLNSLIGIDKLDLAFQTMHEVINGFRDRLRQNNGGHDDRDIDSIKKEIEKNSKELDSQNRSLEKIKKQQAEINEKISLIDSEISRMEPLSSLNQKERAFEESLVKYINNKKNTIVQDISRLEPTVREGYSCFQLISQQEEVKIRLQMINAELEEIEPKISNLESDIGRLEGLLECSTMLEIKDGRCPVCNTPVTRINTMLDKSYLKKEEGYKLQQALKLKQERKVLQDEKKVMEKTGNEISIAENFLANNLLYDLNDVRKLEKELAEKKSIVKSFPEKTLGIDNPLEFVIDDYSKSLANQIVAIREELKDFDINEYKKLKEKRTDLSKAQSNLNITLGATQKAIENANNMIENSEHLIIELEYASEYIHLLEDIRMHVYNREGFVGSSLRSWALKVISLKASDYAAMFNIGISRIELVEKARDIGISCYGRQGQIDMDSLSGGERVAIALALRFAIAFMMGANRLDFIILDEPTTHLDQERRRLLVKIISEAFGSGMGPLSQIIIITHDAEIFEDSDVDKIYRFSMTENGSRVAED